MKEIKRLSEYEENEIKDLLFGRKVKKIDESTLELDNGLLLEIQANEG
jgi:hypothetical protein